MSRTSRRPRQLTKRDAELFAEVSGILSVNHPDKYPNIYKKNGRCWHAYMRGKTVPPDRSKILDLLTQEAQAMGMY